MKEYITLGSSPAEEKCAQVGEEGYEERARTECAIYKHQMIRVLHAAGYQEKQWPKSFSLVVRSQVHEFGPYFELFARYDPEDEKAADLAFKAEELSPAEWDEEAKSELKNGT